MQTVEELKDELQKRLSSYGVASAYIHYGSLVNLYVIFHQSKSPTQGLNLVIRDLAKPFSLAYKNRDDIIVSDMTGYIARLNNLLPRGYEVLFEDKEDLDLSA